MSDAKASNGAQDPTPSVASDIVVPRPRINRWQVLDGGAAAATITAAGLFGPVPRAGTGVAPAEATRSGHRPRTEPPERRRR